MANKILVGKILENEEIFGDVTIEGLSGSYCYIVDEAGTMVFHPSAEKIGKPVENAVVTSLVEQIQAGTFPEPDVVEYEYKGSTKLAGYYILEKGAAIVVLSADKEDAFVVLKEFIIKFCLMAVAILVTMVGLGFLIATSIAKPIRKLTAVIDRNAALDFSEGVLDKKLLKSRDETGVMSHALEQMRENMVEMVEKLINASKRLQGNSDGLKTIVSQLDSNSCDNSATCEELAASMQETSATTQLIDEKMNEINENAMQISRLTEEGEKNAEGIIDKAEELKRITEGANHKTSEIYSKMRKESNQAIEKAKDISKINELTDAITAIASQTELLSLNASIEAARAGEAGRGFAVVAGEIGKLASQSTETANNITAIVTGVKDAAESMGNCLVQMIQFMEDTVIGDYETFIGVSEQYSADARGFSEDMRTINYSISRLEGNISDITHSIEDINEMVNEAAISITNIAEKATDMVGYANDTGNKAEDNAAFAISLDSIVGQFKV